LATSLLKAATIGAYTSYCCYEDGRVTERNYGAAGLSSTAKTKRSSRRTRLLGAVLIEFVEYASARSW